MQWEGQAWDGTRDGTKVAHDADGGACVSSIGMMQVFLDKFVCVIEAYLV